MGELLNHRFIIPLIYVCGWEENDPMLTVVQMGTLIQNQERKLINIS